MFKSRCIYLLACFSVGFVFVCPIVACKDKKRNKGNKHCCTSSSDIFQNRPKDLLLWTRIFDELKITQRITASTGSQVERSHTNRWESHFGFDSLRAEDAVFDEIDNFDAQHNKFCFCMLFSGCGGKMTNIQNQLFHLFFSFWRPNHQILVLPLCFCFCVFAFVPFFYFI